MLLNFMVTAVCILSRLPKPGWQKPVPTAQDRVQSLESLCPLVPEGYPMR